MMPAGGGHGKKQCLTAYELNFPHVRYFCALAAQEIPVTGYARTDERRDVVASLEHCALSLTRAKESDGAWKWAILSLHSALQGAMVCHLSGTLGINPNQKKNRACRNPRTPIKLTLAETSETIIAVLNAWDVACVALEAVSIATRTDRSEDMSRSGFASHRGWHSRR